jgi:hypothetical protein
MVAIFGSGGLITLPLLCAVCPTHQMNAKRKRLVWIGFWDKFLGRRFRLVLPSRREPPDNLFFIETPGHKIEINPRQGALLSECIYVAIGLGSISCELGNAL